jgi:hypothetical protein
MTAQPEKFSMCLQLREYVSSRRSGVKKSIIRGAEGRTAAFLRPAVRSSEIHAFTPEIPHSTPAEAHLLKLVSQPRP